MKKKSKSKNKNHNEEIDLLARSNLGLASLLAAVNAAGPQGISTNKLLAQLNSNSNNSSNHTAQAFIKRAAKKGLIERIEKEEEGKSEHGHFAPIIINIITRRGKDLLADALE